MWHSRVMPQHIAIMAVGQCHSVGEVYFLFRDMCDSCM